MRIDTSYASFQVEDFQREISIILQTEPTEINVITSRPGSTINYFTISDPSAADVDPNNPSNIRMLSGNEKSLLLYQWWIKDDPRISELSFNIIDFKVFSRVLVKDPTGSPGAAEKVEQLFVSTAEPMQPNIPGHAVTVNGNQTFVPGVYYVDHALKVVPVTASGAITINGLSLTSFFTSLFVTLFSLFFISFF